MSDRRVAVALVCFDGKKAAAKARKPLEAKLRSNGDVVLQTAVLRVNAKHKAAVHDVQRMVRDGKSLQDVLAAKLTSPYDARVPGGLAPLPAGLGTSADRFVGSIYAELKTAH